jgi:hypothetical protein
MLCCMADQKAPGTPGHPWQFWELPHHSCRDQRPAQTMPLPEAVIRLKVLTCSEPGVA